MSKLTPLIEQFVRDVVDILRRAPVEDLLRVAGASNPRAPRQLRLFEQAQAHERPRGPKRSAPRRPLPPAENEITDPESLLASVIEPPSLPTKEKNGVAPRAKARRQRVVEEAPPEPLTLPPPAIREGESIVRASRAGVVIRRQKTKQP